MVGTYSSSSSRYVYFIHTFVYLSVRTCESEQYEQ